MKFTAVGHWIWLVTVFGFELCFKERQMTRKHMDTKEKDQGTTTVRCKIIFVCRCGEHRLITQTKWRHIQQHKRTRILDLKKKKRKKTEKEKVSRIGKYGTENKFYRYHIPWVIYSEWFTLKIAGMRCEVERKSCLLLQFKFYGSEFERLMMFTVLKLFYFEANNRFLISFLFFPF